MNNIKTAGISSKIGNRYNPLTYSNINNDAAFPGTSLTVSNGALYGTTAYGGDYGKGTVYRITSNGTESVVYSFDGELK